MPLCLKRAAMEQLMELRVALLLPVSLQEDEIKPAAHMEPGGGGVAATPKKFCSKVPERFLFHYMAERLPQIR